MGLNNPQLFDNQSLGLLTVEQVADVLGKSPNTIRNWIARREFPFVRVGNKHLVLRDSFEAWLKQREVKPWE